MPDSPAGITWRPHISDPTVLAWTITLTLLAAGIACIVCLRRSPRSGRLAAFWAIGAVLFILLALNKQLDLQVLLIQLGRVWTANHAWFQYRRDVQGALVVVLAGVATVAVLALFWTLRGHWSDLRLALLGIAATLAVTLLRATVLCHLLDRLIYGWGTTPSRIHHGLEPLELIGPLCVLVSVVLPRRIRARGKSG